MLEEKIQDWGMYFFSITYGSYAVDQRSGNGWISWWSKIFAFYQRNSRTRLWGTRRENCFSTEQNHPEYPLQKKDQSGGTKRQKRGPFPSWKTDRLPDLRVLPGRCSSKWWCSGIRFEMGRNFMIDDANPIWWHLGKLVQIKNTRVWETQDRTGNCTIWRFIRRRLDLIITGWRQWDKRRDNCSFRHDANKRAKSTQPNPSPRSSTRENVKKCIENQES